MITVAEEQRRILHADRLQKLIERLSCKGYETIGPIVRDGSIAQGVESAAQLPAGSTNEQERGCYRLKHREDQALFGYAAGPPELEEVPTPRKIRVWSAQHGAAGALETVEQ